MKKVILLFTISVMSLLSYASGISFNYEMSDTMPMIYIESPDTVKTQQLKEVTVSSLYRASIGTNSTIKSDKLVELNHGQGIDYVMSTMPNIFAYGDNGTKMGYSYFRMRGMGSERINVTIDGIPWNEMEDFGCYFSNIPDLAGSIHNLKIENGASVTTNGTAAFAGNVSYESVNLKTDTTSYAQIGAGSFNSFRSSVVYNMGIKKNWGLHIHATQQQTDGYKKNTFNNSQNLTVKTGYYFNDNHSIDLLSMNGFHRNGQGFMGIPEEMLPKHPTPFKQMESGNRQQETDNFYTTYNRLQYVGKISKVFLTSSFYWNHQTGDYRIGWDDETVPAGKVLNNYHLVYNMFGINTTVKYFINNNVNIIGGVNGYIYNRRHTGYDVEDPNEVINIWHANGAVPYYNNNGHKNDLNTFATVNYNPVKNFKLTGSVQYRVTELKYTVKTPAYGDVEFDKPFNHTWNFVNYNIGADYTFNRYNNVYAKYSVVNREPSRVDLFGGEYRMEDSPMNTNNETVYDLEFGYNLNMNRFNLNVNGFLMNFSNELVATGELSPTNGLPLHTQMDARRYGVEVSANYNPFSTFNIIMTSSLSKNKLIDIDKTSTFSPACIIFGEVNYMFNNKYKVGVNTQYRSKMYIDVDNKFTLNPLFTLNVYADLKLSDKWNVGINLDNITNRLNISNGSVDGNTAYYLVDNPFTFFINATYKF